MEQPQTSSFFDSYARDFSAIYGTRNSLLNSVVNRLFRESMKLRFFMTIEGCNPVVGKSVLDIGCGPGHYGVALAQRGAKRVLGVDFAKGMIDLAAQNAERSGVADTCEFRLADFLNGDVNETFDYVIGMGFMDYMSDAPAAVRRALSLSRARAFFSFPLDGGVLAWQRRLRYKSRCPLYLYDQTQVRRIFDDVAPNARVDLQRIDRDLFVTVQL
jgi:2-polyprenyl-3-methyl-5-hydroxy-6-metoxy-1,4-benzoquinol methylase